MSCRIHKIMGYGISNLTSMKAQGDSRIAIHPKEILEKFDNIGPNIGHAHYYKWLTEARPDIDGLWSSTDIAIEKVLLKENNDWEPWHSVHWDDEGGNASTIIFTPPASNDWVRMDDNLDWVEHHLHHGDNYDPKVTELPFGIHPYGDMWWDIRTGKRLPRDFTRKTPFSVAELGKPDMDREHLNEVTGYENPEEFAKFVRPAVPPSIALVCEWLGILRDRSVLFEFKPLIHTYWG